ncbi:MAG: L-lactate permease [Planctomycetaceae bacterium]|nr:L-lactate permease [Planctomycetaceae bacterium]
MWTQQYDPMGNWLLSTFLAALPILVLLGLIASGRVSAWKAALCGLVMAIVMAAGPFGMPIDLVLASAGMGFVFALFRIIWLILAALFLYDLAVRTGQFEVMKASIARLSGDRRIQAVLVAFSFGSFLEGASGFGAPVAITAAFLVGLGFEPFKAALLCLIANSVPVAWGAVGVPIRTLSAVTDIDVDVLNATLGRIQLVFPLIVPFWMIITMVGWRLTLPVWPALLVIGGTFALVQFFWTNFVNYELVAIATGLLSLGAAVVLFQFWRPREEWRFPHDEEETADVADAQHSLSSGRVARAWMPFLLLSVAVIIWGLPAAKRWMAAPHEVPGSGQVVRLEWHPEMPRLHLAVAKGEAITGHKTPVSKDREKAVVDIVPVSASGTGVFLASVLSGLLLGLRPSEIAATLAGTLRRMLPAFTAILCMLALGFVTKYSGMDIVLGLAFTRTGKLLYPLFGTLLGWVGCAVTGSETSSNVLFGNLQRVTARKLGLNEVLMASANTSGGITGKLISPQSIVVAAAATNEQGKEGDILRTTFWHSLALALLLGAIVMLFAHVLTWAVPTPVASS